MDDVHFNTYSSSKDCSVKQSPFDKSTFQTPIVVFGHGVDSITLKG
jgi:hypothetical protein